MLDYHQFTQTEVDDFARLSGDWNPLHTDPLAARRTSFGGCLVHGVLVLLRALEIHQQKSSISLPPWIKINARFLRAIYVGSTVSFTFEQKAQMQTQITVTEAGRTMALIDVTHRVAKTGNLPQIKVKSELPPREVPDNSQVDMITPAPRSVDLFWSSAHGLQLFPKLHESQPLATLASLLAATRVIGMKVPGLHSVFLQLDLDFSTENHKQEKFAYNLSVHRRSSQRMGIEISGDICRGMLWALLRPSPVKQASMTYVKQYIKPRRFEGKRVVIVGGARGLGEIAAKVLAAGGAEVVVGYRLGAKDASAVAEEIRQGGGKASLLLLDTMSDSCEPNLEGILPYYDHVCYFATPPILEGSGVLFSDSLFTKFHNVYVVGLMRIACLLAQKTDGRFGFFNASSVYVECPPLRHLEYAAAKAASDACCRWLALAHPQANIHVGHFPQLLTDQTASFITSSDQDTFGAVAKELSQWLTT